MKQFCKNVSKTHAGRIRIFETLYIKCFIFSGITYFKKKLNKFCRLQIFSYICIPVNRGGWSESGPDVRAFNSYKVMGKYNLTWISNQVKKESTKEVNFASLTKVEKIAYLETLVNTKDAKKTFKKSVKVANLSKDKKFELIAIFAGMGNLEAVAAIANDNKDFETEIDVVITYDKMSDSQKLDFLKCENPVEDDTKVKIEVFGGENVVEVLKAVRGLSDEEFNALITK